MIYAQIRSSACQALKFFLHPKYASLVQNVAWVAAPFIMSQSIRLGTSIVIAWLLAPELMGLMLLINTLRTGAELLTDFGIGQSIIGNKGGSTSNFYNTAWTIQIIRGFALSVLALSLAGLIADLFNNNQLFTLLLAVSPIFAFTGLAAPSQFLLQKSLHVREQALFELAVSLFGSLAQITLAWAIPSIWALILGLLISSAISTIFSYFMMDWRTLRIQWDSRSAREILDYGKWIFISSIIYFFAMNFDRLYFSKILTLDVLGIFAVARTFSEATLLLFARFCQVIAFPMISAAEKRGKDLRSAIMPIRFVVLFALAIILSVFIVAADGLITVFYDERYIKSGIILTILLFGTWFSILGAMADAIMMGVGKPGGIAAANAAKLALIVIGLPLTSFAFGFAASLGLLVLAELIRYATLMASKRSVGLGFARQDVIMTILFLGLVFLLRESFAFMGLTGGVSAWIEQIGSINV